MGQTIIEKIMAHNTGAGSVTPGQIITVNADRVMIDDIMMSFIVEKFEEMGFKKIWDPDKVVMIYDHLVPASVQDDVRAYKIGDAFAEKYGLTHIHRSDGICHQLMTEQGYVKPGDVVFGTDSHTTTYGCVGAFSTGIGYTEMAAVLGTGELWVRVPETIKIEINGTLPRDVTSKDMILRIIGDLRADGATYCCMEFVGDTVSSLTMAGRMTMSNMAVEAGAKCAVFTPDEKTAEYCGITLSDFQRSLTGDADAHYSKILRYNAENFTPVLAAPSQVDNIHEIEEFKGTPVDEVFLGSCTNGRLEDLRAAADILRGKKVAPFVRLIVTPASRKVYEDALSEGILSALADAGAMITHPACGLCCGRAGGILSDDEVVVATNNRNFLGRMGSAKVKIFLASPVTAAACALTGEICSASDL